MTPRGRRPAGEDTRATILQAARQLFASHGYDATSMRGIAREAGVDARLVHHWFASKGELFMMALAEVPLNPAERIATIVGSAPPDRMGEALARGFLTFWDDHPGRFEILARAVTSSDAALRPLIEYLASEVIGRVGQGAIATGVSADEVARRAALCASQIVGLGLARYVLKMPGMVDASLDQVAADVGPTLQRYLTGELTRPARPRGDTPDDA